MTNALTTIGLSKRFRQRFRNVDALQELTLEISEGSIFARRGQDRDRLEIARWRLLLTAALFRDKGQRSFPRNPPRRRSRYCRE